jgi:hypothetical protein
MINVNESTAALRRIPFYLVDSTTGLTGQTGVSLTGSDLQLSKNGAAFASFAGSVTEVGNGFYYYQCTAGEVDTPGFLALKVVESGVRTLMIVETINAEDFYDTFRVPFYLVDSLTGLTPQTSVSITGAELQVSENGAAFASFAGSITEVGSGLYYYTPHANEISPTDGFFTIKVVKTGVRTLITSQDYEEGYLTDASSSTVSVTLPEDEEDYALVEVYDDGGINYIHINVQDRTDGPRLIAYETDVGFIHPFNGASTVSGSGTSVDPYIFHVYRRGRWPTGIEVVFRVKVVDGSGNSVEVEE